MSLARLYYTKKSRKPYTCTKCRETIPVGSPVVTFAVGFRGRDQRRHNTPDCAPTLSDRESSAVSAVYAAQESVDLDSCHTLSDLQDAVQEVVDACREVAEEYESNPMYDINYDLQERAETLNSAADDLESWADGLDDEPDEEIDCEDCGGEGCETCGGTGKVAGEDAHEEWLDAARDAAQEAIDNIELP
jgi:hypothetical protein